MDEYEMDGCTFIKFCGINERKFKNVSAECEPVNDELESNDSEHHTHDIYDNRVLDDLVENDEIDTVEHGFMMGYMT